MLTEKEWLFINDIIKEIYTANSLKQLGDIFLPLIRRLVSYKAAVLTMVDDQLKDILYSAVGFSEEDVEEYNRSFVMEDYRNSIFTFPKSMTYCDSDLITEERRRTTRLYTEWLEPMGAEYCGGIMIKINNQYICCINIYTDEVHGPLNEKDLYVMDLFIGHLENIIEKILVKKSVSVQSFEHMEQYNLLTRREKEMLPFIIRGYSNDDLIEEFCISRSTVKKHLYSILTKFEVASRVELIKLINEQS